MRLIREYKAEMRFARKLIDAHMAAKGLTYGDIVFRARMSHKWDALKAALRNAFTTECPMAYECTGDDMRDCQGVRHSI